MATHILLILLLCIQAAAQITNVSIGSNPNDGAGDTLRTAFSKVNTNTAWLSSQLGSTTNTVANKADRLRGIQVLSAESGLYGADPTNGYVARVFTGTTSSDWNWNSTEGGPDVSGERIHPTNYVTGSWIRGTSWATSKSSASNRGLRADASGQLVASDATAQQIDKTAMQVDTIAALRLLTTNLNNGTVIQAGGYWTNGDGGGGPFRVDTSDSTSADNGGTVIVTTSGSVRIKAIYEGNTIPLRRWGLIGDGTTDDTARWDALNTYLNSSSGAGAVVLAPKGIFTISHAIAFSNSVSIIGAGRSNTFFQMTAPVGPAPPNGSFDTNGGTNSVNWYFVGSKGINLSGFTLQNANYPNFSYYTNYYTAATAARIYSMRFRLVDDITMRDVVVKNAYYIGVKIEGCHNVVVEDSAVDTTLRDAYNVDVSSVTTLKESKFVRFSRCVVTGHGDAAFGLNSEPGSSVTNCPQNSDIIVDSCKVYSPANWSGGVGSVIDSEPAVNVSGPRNVRIVNNDFRNARRNSQIIIAHSASSVNHSMSNIVMEGNTFAEPIGDNDNVIAITQAYDVSLLNNSFVNSVGILSVNNATNVNIVGNTIINSRPQQYGTNELKIGSFYRVSGGVIVHNGVTIDGTTGAIASREFSAVNANYTVSSGSPIVYNRGHSIYAHGANADDVIVKNNSVDTWPLGFVYSVSSTGDLTVDGNVCYNTQTLGDSTFGVVYVANIAQTIAGNNNQWLNVSSDSPGIYVQAGTSPKMKVADLSTSYGINRTFIRVLTSGQTTTANTTLTDISGLTMTLRPYRTYKIRLYMQFTLGDASMGYKFGWTTPSGVSLTQRRSLVYNSVSKAIADYANTLNFTAAINGSLANADRHQYEVEGTLTTGASGGSIIPQFAQNFSTGGTFTIHSGACVEVTELTNN